MKAFLNKIEYIDQEILDKYISYWTEYTVPKKTIMTAPGETERYMYYVIEGIQKSYYLNEDKQHVMAFTYPPSFSGIPESFLTQTPSRYFLETITESSFFRISFDFVSISVIQGNVRDGPDTKEIKGNQRKF